MTFGIFKSNKIALILSPFKASFITFNASWPSLATITSKSSLNIFKIKFLIKLESSTTNIEKYLECSINQNYVNRTIEGIIATNVVETDNLLDVKLIVATTISGETASLVSNLRPKSLILATCPNENVARSLALNFGVYPILIDNLQNLDSIIEKSKKLAKDVLQLKEKDSIIITGGYPFKKIKYTNFMKIEEI